MYNFQCPVSAVAARLYFFYKRLMNVPARARS